MNPQHPQNKFIAAPASLRPEHQGARVVDTRPAAPRPPLPRAVPTLTVYADGLVNLNGEATELLSALGAGATLHAPRPHRQNAGNPRRPNLWEISAGDGRKLLSHGERGNLRFKAGKVAPPAGRYLLTPMAGHPDRFTLVPA